MRVATIDLDGHRSHLSMTWSTVQLTCGLDHDARQEPWAMAGVIRSCTRREKEREGGRRTGPTAAALHLPSPRLPAVLYKYHGTVVVRTTVTRQFRCNVGCRGSCITLPPLLPAAASTYSYRQCSVAHPRHVRKDQSWKRTSARTGRLSARAPPRPLHARFPLPAPSSPFSFLLPPFPFVSSLP